MAKPQVKYIPRFSGGINRYGRVDTIQDMEMYQAKNFRFFQDALVLSTGYEHLTAPISTGAVSDVEEFTRLVYEFELSDGTTELLLITNYALYKYDNVSSWDQVRTSTSEDFTTNYAVNNKLTDAGHSLSNDDLIKLTSDDTLPTGLSEDVIYYVINAGANDFEVALTSGGVAVALTSNGVGTHTYHPCFNGLDARAVIADTWTPLDAVVFTNGVDPVWIYTDDGGGYEVRPLGGLTSGDSIAGLVATAVSTCRALVVWNTRLWLLYTTEGSDILPQQIRWCSVADIEDWDNTAPSDGGYERLADKDDAILGAYRLAKNLVVYRDGSIVVGQWVGTTSRTVRFDEAISDEGPLGPNAVAVTKDFHFFFGRYNAYTYKGGTALTEVGDNIRSLVYGASGIMRLDKRTDITSLSISSTREIWTSILVAKSYDSVGSPTSYKSVVLIYNLKEKSWTLREFDDVDGDTRIVNMAEARFLTALLWNQMTFTWQEAGELRWNSQIFATDFPGILLCSKHDVFNFDFVLAQDEGEDIPFEFISKAFTTEGGYFRSNHVELQHSGGGATLSYSTDYGTTFTTIGTLSASSAIRREKLFLNVSSEAIQFKLTGTGGGFKLQSFKLDFTLDSEF